MKRLFLVVFVLLIGCVTQPQHNQYGVTVPQYIVLTDSAANRTDYYLANTSGITDKTQCLNAIKEVVVKATESNTYQLSESALAYLENGKLFSCEWSRIVKSKILFMKMNYPMNSNSWVYGLAYDCDGTPGTADGALAFPVRSDAEIAHALVLKMIDLHR